MAWGGYDGNDYEIFYWNAAAFEANPLTYRALQITANTTDDIEPQISGNNIVWTGNDGSDTEIYYYNTVAQGTPPNISANSVSDESPRIFGDRVVWNTRPGQDWEVAYYQIGSTATARNLSARSGNDWKPQISGDLVIWRNYDGYDYEILAAIESEPMISVTFPITIYGDNVLEPDEYFSLVLTGATVPVTCPTSTT